MEMIDLALYQRAYVELQSEFSDAQNEFLKRIRAAQLKFMETVSGRTPEPEKPAKQEPVGYGQADKWVPALDQLGLAPAAERMTRDMGQMRDFGGEF